MDEGVLARGQDDMRGMWKEYGGLRRDKNVSYEWVWDVWGGVICKNGIKG